MSYLGGYKKPLGYRETKLAKYFWDRDAGDTELWHELSKDEQQNVAEKYNVVELLKAVDVVAEAMEEGK